MLLNSMRDVDPIVCGTEGPIKWIIGLFRRKKP